ncbi:MAG: hypothetical protein M1490_02505 [Candidatus Bathyarchaeota archaeon]|nr:hypothetical protein [Candidatus Bathyarchaeota archaeon]
MEKLSGAQNIIDNKQAIEILTKIEEQLIIKFDKLRKQKYNPNTKGYDYEEIVKQFYEDYVGGAFDVQIRMGILDAELKALSVFSSGENEFDVIGTYRTAVPRIVHQRLVPYDSVAFIIEVKQTLTINKLKDDLAKLCKLKELRTNKQRFNFNTWFPPNLLWRPTRVLFYYEARANRDKVCDLLEKSEAWDLCIVLKDNNVLMNSTIPSMKTSRFKDAKFIQHPDFALVKTLLFTCIYIERDYVSSWELFSNLIRATLTKE